MALLVVMVRMVRTMVDIGMAWEVLKCVYPKARSEGPYDRMHLMSGYAYLKYNAVYFQYKIHLADTLNCHLSVVFLHNIQSSKNEN